MIGSFGAEMKISLSSLTAIMEPRVPPSERVKAAAAAASFEPTTNQPANPPEVITIRVVRCRGGGSCAFDGFCIEGSLLIGGREDDDANDDVDDNDAKHRVDMRSPHEFNNIAALQ